MPPVRSCSTAGSPVSATKLRFAPIDGTSATITGVPLPGTTVSASAGAATGKITSIATAASGHAPDGERSWVDVAKKRRVSMIIGCISECLGSDSTPAADDRNRTCFGSLKGHIQRRGE